MKQIPFDETKLLQALNEVRDDYVVLFVNTKQRLITVVGIEEYETTMWHEVWSFLRLEIWFKWDKFLRLFKKKLTEEQKQHRYDNEVEKLRQKIEAGIATPAEQLLWRVYIEGKL